VQIALSVKIGKYAMTPVFQRSDIGVVTFSTAAVEVFDLYKQVEGSQPEGGGVLLGRMIDGSSDIVVDQATKPNPADRRSRFSFIRKKQPAQEKVNRAWADSEGTSVYLGEWHSHPEDFPTPSSKDLRNWKRILRDVKCDYDALFFLIIGRKDVVAWEGSRASGNLLQLWPAR
jgi:integrative and conjugative element protein (TIGR02256 family)